MFCPRCGQPQQKNNQTRFCSQCGFSMTGMDEIIASGGLPEIFAEKFDPNAISPRKRGIKQGALLFLSGFIIVPLASILTIILDVEPYGAVAAAIFTFLAGFLWMVYSLIFQSGVPTPSSEGIVETIRQDLTGKKSSEKSLPSAETAETAQEAFRPAAGNWRETADLHPSGVTNETTKTLDKKLNF